MSGDTLTFKAAAIQLLKHAGRPMTAKELTAQALAQGLIKPEGETPEATMAAQLYMDIKKNAKSLFVKAGKGKFALLGQSESASSPQLIIQKQNALVQAALKKHLHEMDAYQFELLIGELLQKLGYQNVVVTKRSGDKGVDIMADLTLEGITDVKTVVQVKRYKEGNNIPGKVVTQLRGSAAVDQRGLIITTSNFTKDAIAEAKAPQKMPVALVNGEKLVSLLMRHEVGVTKDVLPLYSVDSEYFENPDTGKGKDDKSGKSRALWPLPGGTSAYVDTLLKFLAAVEAGVKTKPDLIAWYFKTYVTVKSENTANGYINVPRSMGLVAVSNGEYVLTEAGKQFLATRDNLLLYKTLVANVLGVEEIVEFLETADEPQPEEAILEFLKENLDIQWTTFAQVTFRLLWLANVGKIKKTDGGWVLVK